MEVVKQKKALKIYIVLIKTPPEEVVFELNGSLKDCGQSLLLILPSIISSNIVFTCKSGQEPHLECGHILIHKDNSNLINLIRNKTRQCKVEMCKVKIYLLYISKQ